MRLMNFVLSVMKKGNGNPKTFYVSDLHIGHANVISYCNRPYKDAYEMWEKTHPLAKNRCKMPDIDGYQMFKKSYLGLVKKSNLTNSFFNSVDFKNLNV